jgi:hypothetical protein
MGGSPPPMQPIFAIASRTETFLMKAPMFQDKSSPIRTSGALLPEIARSGILGGFG